MDVSRFLHPRGLPCPDALPARAEVGSGRPRVTWPSLRLRDRLSSLSDPDGATWTCGWKSGGRGPLRPCHFQEPRLVGRHRSQGFFLQGWEELGKAPGVWSQQGEPSRVEQAGCKA